MLYFAALIQNNLRKCANVSQLFVLNAKILSGVDDLFSLLLNDGLVLIAHHFFLLLKVGDDLSKRLFQDLDLVFVRLNLTGLHLGALLVLLFSACIDSNVSLDLLVNLLLSLNLLLVLFQFVTLRDCL